MIHTSVRIYKYCMYHAHTSKVKKQSITPLQQLQEASRYVPVCAKKTQQIIVPFEEQVHGKQMDWRMN